ncbi:16S rRNA (cytosine(1402)-N(4))-methyltransferase RsmH [Corynebacterium sp. HMSC04H06]|uniref:16S rRNA (cytosine(1402)-N(4))-methyltransferase RsmH n=1 Tax=Corynebacterium sp. HMSC04H06 TaxID=1581050 RepID=UPI0008A35BC9|nr:16S rRNA (cytosine(1402)-N(4))-methyltransferase RsmH [Corynebacterium sp. HMSC04H06]OFS24096.1 16S rRNA (cytosine(1402)-N(4))-methyltransferase [Corynebacterium sp. HMSC04H06]
MASAERNNHGHVPVMRERMAELLAPAVAKAEAETPGGAVLVDGTLGAGGHTEYFLETFPEVSVIGVDRDGASLAAARERLAKFGDRFVGVQARFDEVGDEIARPATPHAVVDKAREWGIAGALFDLGVSSMQLDQAERGFAYSQDAPLDMRMDPSQGITAADVLNTYDHGNLARILKTYGDERFAGKIASAVVREREKEPFRDSARLVELLYATIPAATRRTGGHPAKRTFQALRVEVNRELEAIEQVLPVIAAALRVGGRAVFMSYQSLEDRLVKQFFKDQSTSSTPEGLPMDLPGTEPDYRVATRGAEKASEAEIAENPRAASVRVRALERISGTPQLLSSGGTP